MGRTQRGIAWTVGLDRKTVVRYLAAAKAAGVSQDGEDVRVEQLAGRGRAGGGLREVRQPNNRQ